MYFKIILMLAFLDGFQNSGAVGKTSLEMIQAKDENIVIKTCTLERVYRLIGYDCANMNLKEIPQHLKTSLEVFDVSFNRIRELTKKSFLRYPNLKYLYLFDNMIQFIENGTFSHLSNLEAIDLSINGLSTISMDLLDLPRLRNLYYNDNSLIHLADSLMNLKKPIKAPLQKVSLANCRLSAIPDFGILPELLILNISFNLFDQITPNQFSPMCSLTKVAIENSTDMSPCMCKTLKAYFDRRSITVQDVFDCATINEDVIYCSDVANSTTESSTYLYCMSNVLNKKHTEESKKIWLIIFCVLAGLFVMFICLLYIFQRCSAPKLEVERKQNTEYIHQKQESNVEILLLQKI